MRKLFVFLFHIVGILPAVYIFTRSWAPIVLALYIIIAAISFFASLVNCFPNSIRNPQNNLNVLAHTIEMIAVIGSAIYLTITNGWIQILCTLAMWYGGMELLHAICVLLLPSKE